MGIVRSGPNLNNQLTLGCSLPWRSLRNVNARNKKAPVVKEMGTSKAAGRKSTVSKVWCHFNPALLWPQTCVPSALLNLSHQREGTSVAVRRVRSTQDEVESYLLTCRCLCHWDPGMSSPCFSAKAPMVQILHQLVAKTPQSRNP